VGIYFGTNTLYQVDPVSCAVVHSIPAPSIHVGGLAWDGSALWCVPEQTGRTYRLNPADGAVLADIPAPSFGRSDPNASDVAWDGVHLWHVDYEFNRIFELNPADGAILNSFPCPGLACSGIEYSAGVLTISDVLTGLIYLVDPTTGTAFDACNAPGGHTWGLAKAPSGLWNADTFERRIYRLAVEEATRSASSTWGTLKLRYR
jgi:hypothetical protein